MDYNQEVYFLERIKSKLENLSKEVNTGYLDTTFYRDDFRSNDVPTARETRITDSVDGKDVVIVDDVLFTGRTVRSAMEGIMNFGRPKKIELLVLIDRYYSREIPIEPTYCGIKLNTITSERVEVNLTEQGFEEDSIIIKISQMNNLNSKDILGTRNLSIEEINLIFDTAKKFKEVLSRPIKKVPSFKTSNCS